MQMIRTTITLPKDLHKDLKREATEKETSLNTILVEKIMSISSTVDRVVTDKERAFESIKALRKKINTQAINYRDLIEYGRKY